MFLFVTLFDGGHARRSLWMKLVGKFVNKKKEKGI